LRALSWHLLLLLLAAAPAFGAAQKGGAALEPGGFATVSGIVDGDTLTLDDGRRVRLAGVQAPKRPPEFRPSTPWPPADAAKAALAALAKGWLVELRYGGVRRDRHGWVLAHLFRADGAWIEGEMLRQGWARVDTLIDNRARAAEMLDLERAARRAGRGLWRERYYAVRHVEESVPREGFHLVEGRILRAARQRDGIFLDFGADWRRDFSVRVPAASLRLFREAGLDPLALAGASVRVRGWLRWQNGPLIEADHPEQIELLRRPNENEAQR
jgi:endonuclease YncB( thermonuclease family)